MKKEDEDHPLGPALAATESILQSAIDDVCEDTDIAKTRTDELIRIEEGLAIASEAAKRAISLRKRIRADESQAPPPMA